ncbi:hypothetical protein NQ317_008879 [Molorchus minor]|uniref:Uncharacterized protein n=1 Tax=Molorchus minor TaxID=1323400 RepID=A0ABQ9JLI2_9CUCU|nr:hypothetical protein NQ317_008879 [Molorchus minor]
MSMLITRDTEQNSSVTGLFVYLNMSDSKEGTAMEVEHVSTGESSKTMDTTADSSNNVMASGGLWGP